ncbi:MAG TPA: phage/plasmid replication protein [Pedobacter sp.]|jgi:hypothetical protein
MIDSIELILSNKEFDSSKILKTLSNQNLIQRTTQYEVGYKGKSTNAIYKNFNFSITPIKVKICGSLTKLHAGNNIVNTSYYDDLASIKELEAVLGISLGNALVNRIDIAYNFQMEHEIYKYLDLLFSPLSTFKDIIYGKETKEFRNKDSSIIFYDKVKEAFLKKRKPIEFKNLNLLRYELRLRKLSFKKLGICDLTFKDLSDRSMYSKLIDVWYNNYQRVPKLSLAPSSAINFKKLSTCKDSLVLQAISSLEGIERVMKELDCSNATAKTKFAIRQYFLKIKEHYTLSPLLVQELDEKVEFVYSNM